MNVIYKLIGIIFLIVSLGVGWLWQSLDVFTASPVRLASETVEFTIAPGASVAQVAYQLERDAIISDASRFRWMVRLSGGSQSIKMGEYILRQGMTPKDIQALFVSGKVKQYAFTIVEGWSFKQLLIALAGNNHLQHLLKDKSQQEVMLALGYAEQHYEGRFLPDTYHFPSGSTDIAFLQRAFNALEKALDEEWRGREEGLPYANAYEALTMASIVEKETGVVSERKEIAGVFVRRLHKRMRLQTDPTVIYGMGDKYKGNLRKKDLKKDTPYNTYRRKGLPPTPIALPGRAAINAALHPAKTDALFFVAKGDGSHYFSKTVKEHNRAVRKYQIRQRRADYRSTPNRVTKEQ